jgi:hypothetical protein
MVGGFTVKNHNHKDAKDTKILRQKANVRRVKEAKSAKGFSPSLPSSASRDIFLPNFSPFIFRVFRVFRGSTK